MVQRDGGTVTILGRDNRTVSVRSKEEIGVVLGSEGIPLCLNAVQAGKVMAGIYRNWDAAAYAELCQKFGLPDKKQYKDYAIIPRKQYRRTLLPVLSMLIMERVMANATGV